MDFPPRPEGLKPRWVGLCADQSPDIETVHSSVWRPDHVCEINSQSIHSMNSLISPPCPALFSSFASQSHPQSLPLFRYSWPHSSTFSSTLVPCYARNTQEKREPSLKKKKGRLTVFLCVQFIWGRELEILSILIRNV